MKKVTILVLALMAISFTSCRDQEKEEMSETETIIQEARDNGSEIDVSDDGTKVKIEAPNGDETKIKMDDDGVKIKTDDNN
jgi:hypothetical protein